MVLLFLGWSIVLPAIGQASPSSATQRAGADEAASIVVDLEAEASAALRAARMIRDRDAKQKAYEAIVPTARQVVDHRPDADSWMLLATTLLGARRHTEGRAVASTWATVDPGDWRPHLLIGQALTWDSEVEASLPHLERAAELAPNPENHRIAVRSLGFALEKLRRFDDALAAFESIGDELGAERIRLHRETLRELETFAMPDGTVCIDPDPDDEVRQLEAELADLEAGSGR